MHELSICQSLVDLIADQARTQKFDRVRRVVVEVGALSHVEPDALAFSFDSVTAGTLAEGAALDILEPAGQAWCMTCDDTVEIARRGDPCPTCGGFRLMVTGGQDLRLKELEVV